MKTLCAGCGPGVSVDEDGCCATCGADASGPGAEASFARIAELEAENARYADVVHRVGALTIGTGYEPGCGCRAIVTEFLGGPQASTFDLEELMRGSLGAWKEPK